MAWRSKCAEKRGDVIPFFLSWVVGQMCRKAGGAARGQEDALTFLLLEEVRHPCFWRFRGMALRMSFGITFVSSGILARKLSLGVTLESGAEAGQWKSVLAGEL